MNYKHVTLFLSLKGLSPRGLISTIEKEGFQPLFSRIVTMYSNFIGREDPFKGYKKIAITKTGVFREITYDSRVYYSVGRRRDVRARSFAELFRHEKYPEIIFSIHDASEDKEKSTWLCCWSWKDKSLDEPFEYFITKVFKAIGCDKPLDEILESETFSKSHNEVINNLAEYNLRTASLEERKTLFEIFSDEKIRGVLIDFNKKDNILLSDFLETREKEDKEELERTLNFLSGQKILNKSLIVVCRKTGQWWNMTVPSKEKLKEIEKSGVTCTSCGAKISEERIDNLFKISEKGKRLVSGSYWMLGQVVKVLLGLGVREKDVFVEVTYNGEEIDIIALYMANLLVFELKDREFGLGDAYKFHGKVSRLYEKAGRPTIFPIVVTTKTVATEARKLLGEVARSRIPWGEYLERTTGPRTYLFAEGLIEIEPMIKKLLDETIKSKISLRMRKISKCFPALVLKSVFPSE